MLIRTVDTDDAALHELYVVLCDAVRSDNPERPMQPEESLVARVRDPGADGILENWGAYDSDAADARLLGSAMIYLPQLDNVDKAHTGVCVAQQSQRQGIGGALADHAIGRAQAHGRTVVLAESTYSAAERDTHGYRRFAEAHGFELASSEVRRELTLPVDTTQLQAWVDEAAPYHRDYRVDTFEEVPDGLIPSLCQVRNQLALDAPSGDIEFEAHHMTPDVYRHRRDRDRRAGITSLDTVGVDSDNHVVAVTTINVSADDARRARQQETIVARDHRGHRLGLALKATNLLALQHRFPTLTSLDTSNHEDNAAMVSINERMGFRAVELNVSFMRILPSATTTT